ncbi:MAG: hypothetical protein ABXS93_05550 [Sulfurimonas sp.]
MRYFIFTLLFTTLVFANNPKVYAALGDVIYNNAPLIEDLKDLEAMQHYKEKIEKYIEKVTAAKKEGFALEKGDKTIDKKEYLSTLRALSKENDFLLRMVRYKYSKSIENENSQLFSELINSGLIDTQEQKQTIIEYYFDHQEDINATGVIEDFLDQDEKLRAQKEAEMQRRKSAQERETANIKRIREKDKREQEALEQKLQKELEQKKKEVLQEQKKELLKTR